MKDSIIKLSQNIIFALTVATAVVFPLFFLPTTSEFFEYNKFFALLIITLLGLIIWSVKMVAEKRTVLLRVMDLLAPRARAVVGDRRWAALCRRLFVNRPIYLAVWLKRPDLAVGCSFCSTNWVLLFNGFKHQKQETGKHYHICFNWRSNRSLTCCNFQLLWRIYAV